jgi:hypothetical protein
MYPISKDKLHTKLLFKGEQGQKGGSFISRLIEYVLGNSRSFSLFVSFLICRNVVGASHVATQSLYLYLSFYKSEITGFLYFIHRPVFRKPDNTTFQKPDLFPSSAEVP